MGKMLLQGHEAIGGMEIGRTASYCARCNSFGGKAPATNDDTGG